MTGVTGVTGVTSTSEGPQEEDIPLAMDTTLAGIYQQLQKKKKEDLALTERVPRYQRLSQGLSPPRSRAM